MAATRVAIDTMYAIDLLAREDMMPLANLIASGKVMGILSTITIAELVKVLGQKDEGRMKAAVDRLLTSELVVSNVTYGIAHLAGMLGLRHSIPTADSIIAATGIIHGAKHILTDDAHFSAVKGRIKPVDYRQFMALCR